MSTCLGMIPGWDEELLRQLSLCDSERPILSSSGGSLDFFFFFWWGGGEPQGKPQVYIFGGSNQSFNKRTHTHTYIVCLLFCGRF